MYTLFFVFLILIAPEARADAGTSFFSSIPCNSYQELFTAESYNPCVLAAALIANCSPTDITIYPLSSTSTSYAGPNSVQAGNPLGSCYCTGAVYNALSACAWCQTGIESSWKTFASSCSSASPGYPSHLENNLSTLSSKITIPAWAKLDTTVNGFDIVDAESAGLGGSTSSHNLDHLNTLTTDYPFATGKNGFDFSLDSHVNYAAIAGGVIAGFAVCWIILGVIAYILVRKRKRRAMERLSGKL